MWTCAELKSQAKEVLRGRYWVSVATVLIFLIITIVGPLFFSWIPVLGFLCSLAFQFFLINPLSVGQNFYFMQTRLAPPVINNLFFSFNNDRFMKIVGATAWKTLFLFLWTLIPVAGVLIFITSMAASSLSGILTNGSHAYGGAPYASIIVFVIIYIAGLIVVAIKAIAYSMTEYILTDNPYISYDRALKLSIEMTYGHKGHIFVLDLSFIGWFLLSILTLYTGLIFLMPYYNATFAELYVKLRHEAIQNGLTSPQELNLIVVNPPPFQDNL